MRKTSGLICLLFFFLGLSAQTVQQKLKRAVDIIQQDPQMNHAILALSVLNSKTGEKLIEVNAQTGLAPASCQKIITSATALELLGPSFRYPTTFGYDGKIKNDSLNGNLWVIGSGDPSLGSWRFNATREEKLLQSWTAQLKARGIIYVTKDIRTYTGKWEPDIIPGGWIWDDIGNYYGAGASILNWRENQYDLILRSSHTVGEPVSIVHTTPHLYGIELECRVLSASKESGDNAYIYLPPNAFKGYVKGTIPIDEKGFVIAGSFPDPTFQFLSTLQESLQTHSPKPPPVKVINKGLLPAYQELFKHYSPGLDSLNYWFMKKSINLYGEAFIKTIAFEKSGKGSIENGLKTIQKFWLEKGIDEASLQIIDGSGLSPQNRITTDALVKVLQYARTRPWFETFQDALPMYNQMKLKSGTIGGTKSFAGYYTAKDGSNYTIAIIINNYHGSASEMVRKMFKLLDELK